jgi:hypothetical protein
VWLTVLFVLVTAVSAAAAYGIVRPILEDSLSRASDATFRQVAEQWDAQMRRSNYQPTTQDMRNFAETRNLQWGIVRLEGEGKLFILQGDPAVEPLLGVVKNALEAGEPRWDTVQQRSGEHAGQLQATYAVPIRGVTD